MRGVPSTIQTHDDVRNLFTMARDGGLDKEEVVILFRTLLARQYRSVPVIDSDGVKVTTFYFPECQKGSVTACGLTVKSVTHVEEEDPQSENVSYALSQFTLSKALEPGQMLSIYMEDNFLNRNDFNIEEINEYLEVLTNVE